MTSKLSPGHQVISYNKQTKRVAWWFNVLITIHICRSLYTVYRCLHMVGDMFSTSQVRLTAALVLLVTRF